MGQTLRFQNTAPSTTTLQATTGKDFGGGDDLRFSLSGSVSEGPPSFCSVQPPRIPAFGAKAIYPPRLFFFTKGQASEAPRAHDGPGRPTHRL